MDLATKAWARPLTLAMVLYSAGLAALLLAPLHIVGYHTAFWDVAREHIGLGWTDGRERVLDGMINVVLFVPVGVLFHRWFRRGWKPSAPTIVKAVAAAAAIAAIVEAIQIFVPSRHASVADLLADTVGAAIGVAVDVALFRARGRPKALDVERS